MEEEIKRPVVRQMESKEERTFYRQPTLLTDKNREETEMKAVRKIYLQGTNTAFTTNRDRNREEIEMKAVRQMESKGDEWRREKEHGTPLHIHL